MENQTDNTAPAVDHQPIVLPLPVLRDMRGQIIREFDILRVFHFYGRRRGKHREKHYMHKIAVVKDHKSPKYPKVWWFHHTAEMGEGLTNGYIPYSSGTGDQWAIDQTLDGVEVIDSPATLRDENEKRRIPRQNPQISGDPSAASKVLPLSQLRGSPPAQPQFAVASPEWLMPR